MSADAITQFRDALDRAGLPVPEEIAADGSLHRFATNGRASDDSGWYVLHLDGIAAGAFGDWRSGVSETWRADIGRTLTLDEERAHRERCARMRADREAVEAERARLAAERAAELWRAAQPAPTDHPYLTRKGVQPVGLRVHRGSLVIGGIDCDGALVLPLRDTSGALHSVEFIAASGEKRYLPGGRIAGCYFAVGQPDGVLVIAEGYATAASVYAATGYAAACATSAGNLLPVARALREKFPKARIIIAADHDESGTGERAALDAASAVDGLVAMPDSAGADWNDVLLAQGAEAVCAGIGAVSALSTMQPARTEPHGNGAAVDKNTGEKASERERPSISTVLVEIAQEHYTFGVSTLGEAFALPRRGPKIVSTLRGGKSSLRAQLAQQYFRRHGRAPAQQALADALLVVEGMAQEADPVELYQRVARHGDALYLDMADQTGRALAIHPGSWEIEARPPMLFRRTALTAALPTPIRGSSLEDLWNSLNVAPADRPLVLAWLIAALMGDIPHPVLSLQGEQGTAKTTALRTLVSLIDPSPAPTRKPPRDPEGWITAAAGSWIVGIDNLSSVSDWLSDSICRAVTGDGDVRRKLYTDGEHAVFAFRRAVAITSIDLGALRGDLAERMLPITLAPITESKRMRDAEIVATWSKALPGVFGALLTLAADVLRRLPTIRLPAMPRMADYAQVIAAVDQVMGTEGLSDYLCRQRDLARDTLTSDPLILAVIQRDGVTGTAADIYMRLTPERPPRDWPANARVVTQRLRRHAPAMRRTGWTVADDGGHNHRNALVWTIRPPVQTHADTYFARNGHSQGSQDSQAASVASVASVESLTTAYPDPAAEVF